MSGASDKAVEAGARAVYAHHSIARDVLERAHDPALGLDRSVCLRDVVEFLRQVLGPHDAADFIEREFGARGVET